jgi:hypothetical protein
MAAREKHKKRQDSEDEHELRRRNGLERRVPHDEDDHPQQPLRQASVYEEQPRPPHVPRNLNSSRGYQPGGYELGGYGGGPGDRPWQVPWGGGYTPAEFANMSAGGAAPPSSTSPPVTPPPMLQQPALSMQHSQAPASDPGAFGGAGMGGYNEGAFTLGPFFGHSIGYAARPSLPPATPPPAVPTYALPQQPTASFRGRGPKGYERSDERLWEEVCDCLLLDEFVDASNIEVTVEQGEVTLDGTVPDRDTKRRAEDLIDQIPGVKHTQNNLRFNR